MSQVSELQLVWNILFRVVLGPGPGVGPGPVLTSHKSRGDLRQKNIDVLKVFVRAVQVPDWGLASCL